MKSQRTRRRRSSASTNVGVPKPTIAPVPPSLPLAVQDAPVVPPPTLPTVRAQCPNCKVFILNQLRRVCSVCQTSLTLRDRYPERAHLADGVLLSDDSTTRDTALRIVALRQAGMSDSEIAPLVKLAVKAIPTYIYRAGANGWLDDVLVAPRDRMDYCVMDKVVQRIEEALEDDYRNEKTGMKVQTVVALEVGRGTLFNRNEDQGTQQAVPSTIVGIKVEIVGGAVQGMREGTIIGKSQYLDAEPVE